MAVTHAVIGWDRKTVTFERRDTDGGLAGSSAISRSYPWAFPRSMAVLGWTTRPPRAIIATRMDDDDPTEILSCPSCGLPDLDFQWRSKILMRCGLCSAFVEITKLGTALPKARATSTSCPITAAPSPQPPKRVKIVPR